MVEDLFIKRGAIASYRAAPLLKERLSDLSHCAQAGVRPATLRSIAAHQTKLIQLLDFREGDRVSVARIEAAAARWSQPGGRRCSQVAKPEACRRFIGHAERWLRFVNLLEEPRKVQHAHGGEVAAFVKWMRHERGWTNDTIRGCCSTVDRFFGRLDERGVALAPVGIADLDRAIARWYARDCSRVTIRAWLGHASLDTTNIYAEIDIEMKAKAMALCDAAEPGPDRPWKANKGLMAFLGAL